MSEILNLDMFFDSENLLLNFDKDDLKPKKDKQNVENLELFDDDFLNSILKPIADECSPFDQLLFPNGDEILNESKHECSSDSGLSCEQQFSPTRTDEAEDSLTNNFLDPDEDQKTDIKIFSHLDNSSDESTVTLHESYDINELQFDAVEFVKEEVVECEEIPISSVSSVDSDSNSANEIYVITDENDTVDDSIKPERPAFKAFRTLRVVKVDDPASQSRIIKRFKPLNHTGTQGNRGKRKLSDDLVSEEGASDDSDFIYPRLHLTPEEQKLADKEGIKLPTRYPLTKKEERELKRIRRKIRNKISAQDSRRRKKEYVDGLEERVKRCSEENAHLMKRIKTLQSQNVSLAAQVRKLQASLARSSGQTAQPRTCLLVLIMSLALVLAPTMRNSPLDSENNEDEGISLTEDGSTTSLNTGHSRNLLFSHKAHEGQCDLDEEAKTLTKQLENMQLPNSNLLSGLLDMLKTKIGKENTLLKDHDYFRPRKRAGSILVGEESRLPAKLSSSKFSFNDENILNSIILENTNNNKTGPLNTKEPVVIDLLSE
ncbi:uncharacterized protein LOC135840793 [Planococcus citri]|uniref:uncharacterized protein LOC135840793 n=1 Tax=Planococcus citri TaxID=170843 RepID=UPI0031F96002